MEYSFNTHTEQWGLFGDDDQCFRFRSDSVIPVQTSDRFPVYLPIDQMKVIAFKVCLLLLAAAVAISAAITFWCFALPSWNRNFGDLVKRESNSSNSSSKAAIAIPEWLPPGEDELWRKLESELPFAPLELMRRTQERGKGAQVRPERAFARAVGTVELG